MSRTASRAASESAEAVAVPPEIQARLAQAGLRRTLATRAVIGLFLSRPAQGFTHAQVLAALQARGPAVNRVTLYRLLDRLAAIGVLERHTDGERTWRFTLAHSPDDAAVPRFECDACHQQFRLPDAAEPTRAVVEQLQHTLARLGHQGGRIDLAVHGTCAACAGEPGPDSN